MASLDGGRIGIAAQAVGIARAALDAALDYADERRAFGQPIRDFQGISFKLADPWRRQLEAAPTPHLPRRLAERQGLPRHPGRLDGRNCSPRKSRRKLPTRRCKCSAVTATRRITPVERYFRDARVTEIYEGTSEIQRTVIARQLYRNRNR